MQQNVQKLKGCECEVTVYNYLKWLYTDWL